MDEKMRAAFKKEFGAGTDAACVARVGVEWAINYLREQQEPVTYQYQFIDPITGAKFWRNSNHEWNLQTPKTSRPLYANPVSGAAGKTDNAEVARLKRKAEVGEKLCICLNEAFKRPDHLNVASLTRSVGLSAIEQWEQLKEDSQG